MVLIFAISITQDVDNNKTLFMFRRVLTLFLQFIDELIDRRRFERVTVGKILVPSGGSGVQQFFPHKYGS
jgi:hypothetical protein